MDLAFAVAEHQHIAGAVLEEFVDGAHDCLGLVGGVVVFAAEGPIPHLNRKRASAYFNDWNDAAVRGEVRCEFGRVDRGRSDNEFEIGPNGQKLVEEPEQEVDVEAAFVGLVDNDRVVPAQLSVSAYLGEQNAVGHNFDASVIFDVVGEAHGESDGLANRATEFIGDSLSDGAGGEATGLGVTDHAFDAAPEIETNLGQLRALAGARLAGDHHHLVITDGGADLIDSLGNRQLGRVPYVDDVRRTSGPKCL